MQGNQNKNYFLDKLQKDREINKLLFDQTSKENINFFEKLTELRRILHLKSQTDQQILIEYDKKIVIPTGSEETLIRELNIFNKEMYNDLPQFYTLDFENDTKTRKLNLKQKYHLKPETRKNIFNLSKSYIKNETLELDETKDFWKKNAVDPFLDKNFSEFENNITEELELNKKKDFLTVRIDNDEYVDFVDDDEIYVDSAEKKKKMILDIEENLNNGEYGKLNLSKPISLTTTKYMKKLKTLKNGFVKTYGSELFRKISDWIEQEEVLYLNIDRSNKLSNLKNKKIKFKKIK